MTLYLHTTDALSAFCKGVSTAPYVTMDTEFIREKTYWPQVCLIQVAGPDQAAVIDPLAEGLDLAPLYELLQNPRVLKVFHAARQDIEIFFHKTGLVPAPLFDTQIAAMVCGFGESVGYENLIGKLVNAQIDKSSRYSDWARRPLTDRQLAYALADVTHLRPAYEKLRDQLQRTNRGEWIQDDLAQLADASTYQVRPEDAWKRLKIRSPKPRILAVAKELAAWREREAQARDLPRNWVLKDDAIVEMAGHPPLSHEDLSRMRGLGKSVPGTAQADAILAAVAHARALPEHAWPQPEDRSDFSSSLTPVLELLRVLLKMKADQYDVAPRLIASSADLEALASGSEDPNLAILQGWRGDVFGKDALDLKKGHLSLAIKKGRVVIDRPESA